MGETPAPMKGIGYAPGFQRLLDYAVHDCSERGEPAIRSDHLVLGLYREDFPLIDEVLGAFRVDSMNVLGRLLKANPPVGERIPPESVALSLEAQLAIAAGEREACSMGDSQLTPAHVFLGVLEQRRQRLSDFFVREELVARSAELLAQTRQLVRWLRLEEDCEQRELEVLEDGSLMTLSARALAPAAGAGSKRRGWAVQLSLLSRLG